MPVDSDTYMRVNAIIDRCARGGWDATEALDRAGLLLTLAQRQEIGVHTLTTLLVQLSTYRPVELLRRKYHAGHQATPGDMYTVMIEFIEEWRARVADSGH